MARTTPLLRLFRLSARPTSHRVSSLPRSTRSFVTSPRPVISSIAALRPFSSSSVNFKGLTPHSDNPQPKEPENHDTVSAPVQLTIEEFHQVSDAFLDVLVAKLEQLQEAREDVDVDYSAGVLTLTFPPLGIYVLNKQPPNKQIWLSSPISGPKRYDWVVLGEGQHEKEGSGVGGEWIYLRDGTTLGEVFRKEVGIAMSKEEHGADW